MCAGSSKKADKQQELEWASRVRLRGRGLARLVIEEDAAVVYHCLSNSASEHASAADAAVPQEDEGTHIYYASGCMHACIHLLRTASSINRSAPRQQRCYKSNVMLWMQVLQARRGDWSSIWMLRLRWRPCC